MPADNGGHVITHYEVEKMDVHNNQWLPIKAVKGCSLQVTNLVEGKQYMFLVRACNDAGDSPDLETEEVVTAKNPFDPPSKSGSQSMANVGSPEEVLSADIHFSTFSKDHLEFFACHASISNPTSLDTFEKAS